MRLIDANALIGKLHTQFFYDGRDRSRVYAWIEEQPTIEPKRKKGNWIKTNDRWQCSECLAFALKTDDGKENLSDYCPCCGADMRGGADDER